MRRIIVILTILGIFLFIVFGLALWLSRPTTSETVVAPPTLTATATEFPTLTPSPSQSPSPSPAARPVLILNTDAPNGQLPGDNNSQAQITVELQNFESIDTSNLDIFFEVQGGGSVSPQKLPLQTTPLQITYTAGETRDMKEVQIIALVDVPTIGRITNTLVLQLVRQELQLTLPCAYVLPYTQEAQALPFQLQTTDGSSGTYTLRAFLQDAPLGDLRTDPTGIGSTQTQLATTTGEVVLYYTPPYQSEVGSTHLCISITDRPLMGDICRPIIWGVETTLETRTRPISEWIDGTWAVVWVNTLQGTDYRANSGLISYETLLSNLDLNAPHLMLDKTLWQPNECLILPNLTTTGTSNISFEPLPQAALLRFKISVPSAPDQEQLTLLGAQRLVLRNTAASFFVGESDATLNFQPEQPDAEFFHLLSTQALNRQVSEQQVLLRLYVKANYLDLSQIQLLNLEPIIPAVTSLENYRNYRNQTNAFFTLAGTPLSIDYIDPTPIPVGEELWYAIYFFARAQTRDLAAFG